MINDSRSFHSTIKRSENDLCVPLPPSLCSMVGLDEGAEVLLYRNAAGHIEIQPAQFETEKGASERPAAEVSGTGAASMPKEQMCEICGSAKAKYRCINCKKFACPNCFWELASLCYDCADRS